jgi:choline-sulfatase
MPGPNILIVMTDHQRADTALPEHPALTPHLDTLSRDGITFSNAFCPSPHCCPSRATFFSGLYPSRHGVWNNVCNQQALSTGLRPGVRLWSEDLAAAGYQMHFSGKWHVSIEESPRDRGWTEHFVSAAAGTLHGVTWDHYQQVAHDPDQATRGEGQILRPGYGTYTTYGTHTGDALRHDQQALQGALDTLPSLGKSRSPWCLYVGFIGPHDPYVVPQEYLDLYDLDNVPLPPSYADNLLDKPHIYERMRSMRFGQLSEREVRQAIRHYWAYCSYLDGLLGKLLDALDATGQAEQTLVIYCSDHGDYCGEHGLFAKGIPCFQGAYRVPLIARWPAGIRPPGQRVGSFVSLADVGPTLVEVAGTSSPQRATGASFLPFLRGQTPPVWRDAVYTQCNGVELYYTQRSVMTREFKYVFNGFDHDELYDLRSDPHEMRNLNNDARYEDIKRTLCGKMWRFAHEEDDTAISAYITTALAPYGPAEAFRVWHPRYRVSAAQPLWR